MIRIDDMKDNLICYGDDELVYLYLVNFYKFFTPNKEFQMTKLSDVEYNKLFVLNPDCEIVESYVFNIPMTAWENKLWSEYFYSQYLTINNIMHNIAKNKLRLRNDNYTSEDVEKYLQEKMGGLYMGLTSFENYISIIAESDLMSTITNITYAKQLYDLDEGFKRAISNDK